MKIKFLLLILFLLLISCEETKIEQGYSGNFLYTSAIFEPETIWHSYDEIDLFTNDSIKIIRYDEANKWIIKFKAIENEK